MLRDQKKDDQLPPTEAYKMLDKKDEDWWFEIIKQCTWLETSTKRYDLKMWMMTYGRKTVEESKEYNRRETDRKIIAALNRFPEPKKKN